jgi:nucleoside-diphosphate-sugar epimerase
MGFPRQFVHVEDVARAIVAAIAAPGISGMAFNLSDGTRRRLDAVATTVARLLPGADITLGGGPDPDDVRLGPLDLTAARLRLGWTPAIPLEQGVRDYFGAVG